MKITIRRLLAPIVRLFRPSPYAAEQRMIDAARAARRSENERLAQRGLKSDAPEGDRDD